MQSYRIRRTMPESTCSRSPTLVQAWQESTLRNTLPTSDKRSLPESPKRVYCEERKKFTLPPNMPGSFCIYALHTETKSTLKNAPKRCRPHHYSKPLDRAVKHVLFAHLCDAVCTETQPALRSVESVVKQHFPRHPPRQGRPKPRFFRIPKPPARRHKRAGGDLDCRNDC